MTTIIALFDLAPLLMAGLSVLALSGVFACYRLATLSDRVAGHALKVALTALLLVPAIAYLANNYWLSIHNSSERLALHAVSMNHNHLEAMYFLWWCVVSGAAWILYIWRKRHAA